MKVRFQLPSRMLALLCGLFLTVGAFAQQITVKGLVKDSTGEPVIGATISDSNGKALAVSDFDGNFEVKANSGETLMVSYFSFPWEVNPPPIPRIYEIFRLYPSSKGGLLRKRLRKLPMIFCRK